MRCDLSPEILAIINNTVSIRSPLESLIYLLVISYYPRTVPHIRQSQTTEDLAPYFATECSGDVSTQCKNEYLKLWSLIRNRSLPPSNPRLNPTVALVSL
jgi:hypothetical protein